MKPSTRKLQMSIITGVKVPQFKNVEYQNRMIIESPNPDTSAKRLQHIERLARILEKAQNKHDEISNSSNSTTKQKLKLSKAEKRRLKRKKLLENLQDDQLLEKASVFEKSLAQNLTDANEIKDIMQDIQEALAKAKISKPSKFDTLQQSRKSRRRQSVAAVKKFKQSLSSAPIINISDSLSINKTVTFNIELNTRLHNAIDPHTQKHKLNEP